MCGLCEIGPLIATFSWSKLLFPNCHKVPKCAVLSTLLLTLATTCTYTCTLHVHVRHVQKHGLSYALSKQEITLMTSRNCHYGDSFCLIGSFAWWIKPCAGGGQPWSVLDRCFRLPRKHGLRVCVRELNTVLWSPKRQPNIHSKISKKSVFCDVVLCKDF